MQSLANIYRRGKKAIRITGTLKGKYASVIGSALNVFTIHAQRAESRDRSIIETLEKLSTTAGTTTAN